MLHRLSFALLAAALAGCGGGVFIGFNIGDDDIDGAPSVSLEASPTSARPGEAVALVAAAADASGIDDVAFYRLESDGSATFLGRDASAPYRWTASVPPAASGSVRFFARATDNFGLRADSTPVSVAVES